MTSADGSGAPIIGGCCGIDPDHIRALRENLPKIVSHPKATKNRPREQINLKKGNYIQ